MLWLKRLRLYQDERTLIAVGLIFILALSGGLYMAFTPTTYAVTETIEKNTYETSYSHYSVSAKSSELFEEGERVEEPSRYYVFNHREVQIEFTPKLNSKELDASKYSTNYSVYITAQSSTSDEVLYRSELDDDLDIVSIDGNKVTANIQNLLDYVEKLSEELPQGSQVYLNIDRTTNISQENGNGSVSVQSNADIYFSEVRTYVVDVESEPVEQREERTIQRPQPSRTVTVSNTSIDTTGILVVGISIFILIIFLYLVYVRLYIDKDQEQLRFEYEVDKYSSWITFGKPYQDPTFQDESDIIRVESIKGLVDIAVDNSTRVVHTRQSGRFYVYDEHATYTYTAPGMDHMGFYIGPNEKLPDFDPDYLGSDEGTFNEGTEDASFGTDEYQEEFDPEDNSDADGDSGENDSEDKE